MNDALAPDRWDPVQYNQFADEREQPFWDLARLLRPAADPVVVDLGCGDGRLTATLHDKLGAARTVGVDNSRAMIAATEPYGSSVVTFELGDIGRWEHPGEYDIVYSNAALHWVPDHPAALDRWVRSVRPGGQLAVQVPANADHPAHLLAGEVAAELLVDPPPDPVAQNVLAPERYAALLDHFRCTRQHVRVQVYVHQLGSTADIVEWLKGSTLTRFKEPLGPDGWAAFIDLYRERLLALLGDRSPYAYTFKRILIWAEWTGGVGSSSDARVG